MFGFGPLPHNTMPGKIQLPRLRQATLLLPAEDSVSLYEVRRELCAVRRIVNSQLIEGSGRNSTSDVIQAALLATAALFNLEVPQGEHARLKPKYAQLMTKLTEHSTSTSDTYVCLIFGYAYLGGCCRTTQSVCTKQSQSGGATYASICGCRNANGQRPCTQMLQTRHPRSDRASAEGRRLSPDGRHTARGNAPSSKNEALTTIIQCTNHHASGAGQ